MPTSSDVLKLPVSTNSYLLQSGIRMVSGNGGNATLAGFQSPGGRTGLNTSSSNSSVFLDMFA